MHKEVARGEPHASDNGLRLDVWWKHIVCYKAWFNETWPGKCLFHLAVWSDNALTSLDWKTL